jgi:hypothetical protein
MLGKPEFGSNARCFHEPQLNRLSNVGVMDQLEHRAAGALAQPGQSIVNVRVSIRLGGGRSLPELSPKVYVSLNGRDHHLAA